MGALQIRSTGPLVHLISKKNKVPIRIKRVYESTAKITVSAVISCFSPIVILEAWQLGRAALFSVRILVK